MRKYIDTFENKMMINEKLNMKIDTIPTWVD